MISCHFILPQSVQLAQVYPGARTSNETNSCIRKIYRINFISRLVLWYFKHVSNTVYMLKNVIFKFSNVDFRVWWNLLVIIRGPHKTFFKGFLEIFCKGFLDIFKRFPWYVFFIDFSSNFFMNCFKNILSSSLEHFSFQEMKDYFQVFEGFHNEFFVEFLVLV